MEKEFLKGLEKKHTKQLESVSEFSLKGPKQILTEIVEQEFISTAEEEQKALYEEYLIDFYQHRGFDREEIRDYLLALKENDVGKKKEIFLNLGRRFEEGESFTVAAENYFLAEEYEKALELLVHYGHQGFKHGKEFLYARDCLVAMGIDEKDANSQMAEEFKKMLEKDWPSFKKPYIYSYLGECLHHAERMEEALDAFMNTEEDEEYKLRAGVGYLENIEDYENAIALQERLIKEYCSNNREHLKLAEYYKKVGKRKEEAQALWIGGEYLNAANIAFEITGNKEVYLKAAKIYSGIRSEKQKYFSQYIWKYVRNKVLEIYNEETKRDFSRTYLYMYDPEKMLNKFGKLFSFLYSAFSLPKPKEAKFTLTDSTDENREKSESLYKEFLEKKESVKKSQIREVFSENTLIQSLGYSILEGIHEFNLSERIKEAFKGIPSEVPDPKNLDEKVKEFWIKALEDEKMVIGFDPIEMAAYAYEKGGDYTKAKKKYLKLKRFEDVKRMDGFIKGR